MISSYGIGADYSRGDVEQRITNAAGTFRSDSGICDVNQARNKVERVSEIMKAMIENENKDIGLYYRDRLDFEATRDDMERRGLTDGFIIDEMIGRALAELSAEQNIDDLQIISLDDPNIKEIVGAEAIAGRAYHTGDGKIIIADNIEDFASAIGTITEEGRHIYHRNNNGLEDSEDYASFYGEQFKNYYNRVAGDTPLVMIGSELGYNAGQLGNDWEDDVYWIESTHPGGHGAVMIVNDKYPKGRVYSWSVIGPDGMHYPGKIVDKTKKIMDKNISYKGIEGYGALYITTGENYLLGKYGKYSGKIHKINDSKKYEDKVVEFYINFILGKTKKEHKNLILILIQNQQ